MAAEDKVSSMWLACRAATHVCALPMTAIIETMRPLPVEAFARAPSFVTGLAIIRGEPTPVVSVRALMGEPAGEAGRFVAVRINNRVVALAFDAVLAVHRLNPVLATELPPLLKNVSTDTISAVTARDAELLLFFETARIFPPAVLDDLLKQRAAG